MAREALAPTLHGLRHRLFSRLGQIMCLRITADQKCQTYVGQLLQDFIVPLWRTFWTGWAIAPLGVRSGETKPHWHNGDARFIIKGFFSKTGPFTQSISASVIPGDSACVHACPRRLADNQELRTSGSPYDGSGAMRKMLLACPAGSNACEQL